MRVAWLLLVASCSHGGPAITCKPSAASIWPRKSLCEETVDELALVHRGSNCAGRIAEEELVSLGPSTVPYLVPAFDDGDLAVAEIAMRVCMRLGRSQPVRDWCETVSGDARTAMCRRALGVPEAHRRFQTLDCEPAVRRERVVNRC